MQVAIDRLKNGQAGDSNGIRAEDIKTCDKETKEIMRQIFNQKATLLTDKESDIFEIKTGTKQGDPLRSLLFNTVLQAALEDDLARWREKGMGIRLGVLQSDCLSHLRFAGDVLLFSASLEQLRNMMCDFKKSAEHVGLKIHPEKTILSNQ